MKSTAADELAIKFALSLALGEPNREQITRTVLADKVLRNELGLVGEGEYRS